MSRGLVFVYKRPVVGAFYLVVRLDEIKGAQDTPRRAGRLAPAGPCALGEARADQSQTGSAFFRAKDHVRPDLAFQQDHQVRSPVIEEPVDHPRRVNRHILVKREGRQAVGQDLR